MLIRDFLTIVLYFREEEKEDRMRTPSASSLSGSVRAQESVKVKNQLRVFAPLFNCVPSFNSGFYLFYRYWYGTYGYQ